MQDEILALVLKKLVDKMQTPIVPSRSIHDNLHLMRNTTERVVKEPGMGETLINLDQSKAFDKLDSRYLEAILSVWFRSSFPRLNRCIV